MKSLPLCGCILFSGVVALSLMPLHPSYATDEPQPQGYGGASEGLPLTFEELPPNIMNRLDELYLASERAFTALHAVIPEFAVTNVTVPEAVRALADDYLVRCGIELIPWPLQDYGPLQEFSVVLQGATPRDILDHLVTLDPTFVWVEEQGLANLVIRSAYQDPHYPLNSLVPDFHVDNRPYSMVFGSPYANSLFRLPQVREHLVFTSVGRWPREFEPPVTIDAKDQTVRGIINQVGVEVGMSWYAVAQRQAEDSWVLWFQMLPELVRLPASRCSTCPGRTARLPATGTSQTGDPSVPHATGSVAASSTPPLLALRESLTPYGFAFAWHPETHRAWASNGKTRLAVADKDIQASVNGAPVTLPARPTIEEGRLLVPPVLITLVLNAAGGGSAASPAG